MIDLALDPSETRRAPEAIPRRAAGRRWSRIALFGVIGIAGTGAFASAATTYLSSLAGPQRAPRLVVGQKAADWPDLKDGLPALTTGSAASAPRIREISPAAPPVIDARIEPFHSPVSAAGPDAVASSPGRTAFAAEAAPATANKAAAPAIASKPLPPMVAVPVIGPTRQAALVAPARAVTGLAPLAGETVRARTGNANSPALPSESAEGVATRPASPRDEAVRPEAVTSTIAKPEIAKPEIAKSEIARPEIAKPEPSKAKPRIEAHAKPAAVKPSAVVRPVAEKPAARKAAAVEANAAAVEARVPDEETEVFGIKVPSLAPAGRKLRESVEALGDAVKGIPDRF